MAACTGLLCKPKLIRETVFQNVGKKILNVFQRTLMIRSSILYQWRKIIVKIIVKENVIGNMLNRVISKVLQLALDSRGTATVKNLICKKIIYFEVSCCDWECLNDQTICALCGQEVYLFVVTPNQSLYLYKIIFILATKYSWLSNGHPPPPPPINYWGKFQTQTHFWNNIVMLTFLCWLIIDLILYK